jgi:hypothetical protein
MDKLHALVMFKILGYPVYAYLIVGGLVGVQEFINRSKWLKAQTYAQAVGNVFALAQKTILGKFPIVAQLIALLATMKTPEPVPALAQSAEDKAVQK